MQARRRSCVARLAGVLPSPTCWTSPTSQAPAARLDLTPYDALPIDDVAYSFVPAKRVIRVALVSAGNPSLERSLRLLPRVDLVIMTPRAYLEKRHDAGVRPLCPARAARRSGVIVPATPADGCRLRASISRETAIAAWVQDHLSRTACRCATCWRTMRSRFVTARVRKCRSDDRRPLILASLWGRAGSKSVRSGRSNLPLKRDFRCS